MDEESAFTTLLIDLAEKMDFGDCKFNPNRHYHWYVPSLELNGIEVEWLVPGENDADSIGQGLMTRVKYNRAMDAKSLGDTLTLFSNSKEVVEKFNTAIADAKSRVLERQAAELAEREKAAAEREVVLEERKARLLTEFLEEQGRIRVYGSKSYRPVIVKARESQDKTGSQIWKPYFEWVNTHDYGRQRDLPRVRSFDVKIGGRYKQVWDDGQTDLYSYDTIKRDVPKYDGQLAG